MKLGKLKCIKKWDKDYLTIGNTYEAEIGTCTSVCIMGDDEEFHLVEIHYFELDAISKEVMNVLNIVENFKLQAELSREGKNNENR